MNAKNIKRCLMKKIKNWIESIEDVQLRKDIEPHVIVTGGCIVSMLLKEEVKDYDIYFDNKAITKRVAKYYVDQFNKSNKITNRLKYKVEAFVLDGEDVKKWADGEKKIEDIAPGYSNQGKKVSNMITGTKPDRIKIIIRSDGVALEQGERDKANEPFEDVYDVLDEADKIDSDELEKQGDEKKRYRPVFLSTNAITLSNKIQIVIRFYGEPDEIHKNYDFVHCKNYFYFKDIKLTLRPEAMEAILAKELRYDGSKYPLCSIIRTRKFIGRGWIINAGQYLKMLFQVSELNLQDIDVLEDQLVGVDSAYFMQLVDALRLKQKSDKEFQINYPYVMSIIDRIF